jgi:ATP-dependent Clp protease ATP-binding subunit ClpC
MNRFAALVRRIRRALLPAPTRPSPRKSAAERPLDEDARRALHMATREAQRLRHEYVGTEHLLLGILRDEAGRGAAVLGALGVDLSSARAAVIRHCREGPDMVIMGKLPKTPQARSAIKHAVEEAEGLGGGEAGTEHLVLGLLRERAGVAAMVLAELGVTLERAREEVARLGRGPEPPGQS